MSSPGGRVSDPLREGLRVVELAAAQGLEVRLMGGLAFHALVPDWSAPVDRSGRDIDLAARVKDSKGVMTLLEGEGYVPDRHHNAAFGHKQLYFHDPSWHRPIDVLLGRLEMCHAFEFEDRLSLEWPTLPLADLLLSKLQIVKINRKDVLDTLILLQEFPLGEQERGTISVQRVLEHTSTDWGWWRTVTENLRKLDESVGQGSMSHELMTGRPRRYDPQKQIAELEAAIDAAPKSLRWRLRAAIGEKMPWYELPEEIPHG